VDKLVIFLIDGRRESQVNLHKCQKSVPYFSFSFFNKLFSSATSDSPSQLDILLPCLNSTSSIVSF